MITHAATLDLPFAAPMPNGWRTATTGGTGTGTRTCASGFRRYQATTLVIGTTTKRPLSRPEQRSG